MKVSMLKLLFPGNENGCRSPWKWVQIPAGMGKGSRKPDEECRDTVFTWMWIGAGHFLSHSQ